VEKRKKDRQKLVTKKRNMESLAKDAKRRTEDFESRVNGLTSHGTGENVYFGLRF